MTGQEIRKLRKSLGLTQVEFANKVGISRELVTGIENEKFQITKSTEYALLEYVNSLNNTHLVSEPNGTYNPTTITPKGQVISINKGKFPRKKPEGRILIPFYDIDFTAGDIELFDDFNELAPTYMLDIPEFYGCTAFRVFNNSMEKLIKSGATLFGTKVLEWQDHLEYGPMYGIVCTDKRKYLKYIRKASGKEDSHFLLRSENTEEYDDFLIPKSKIKSLWLIHGALNRYF